MYSQDAIQKLIDRIGWSPAIPPTELVITAANTKSDSGRFFNSYHELAIVENVNECIPNLDVAITDVNVILARMKSDSVRQVLGRVYDTNVLANYPSSGGVNSTNYAQDYSDVIISKTAVFDDCIGYAMAIRFLQLCLTSKRSNVEARVIGRSYSELKVELEGAFDGRNQLIAKGALHNFEAALERTINVLFPTSAPDEFRLRDRSFLH